jgi:DNA-binding response OmpR family regulator
MILINFFHSFGSGISIMSTQKQKVLLVSKADRLDSSFVRDLEAEGISVILVSSISEARRELENHGLPFGMIVNLDQLEEDGLEFCDEMTVYAGLPVILIGSKNSDQSVVSASFQCADTFVRGAEVYTKDIALRLERLFHRVNSFSWALGRDVRLASDVIVDFIGRTIQIKGNSIALTPTETALLHVLAAHSDETVDSETLIERVWRGAAEGNPNALRVHMHRLRRKLGWKRGSEGLIRTVRGTGYTLQST